MAYETVIEKLEGGVLLLTMNRPDKKNAFNQQMWFDMRDAMAAAQSDDSVRVTVVTGAGTAFSAGQDLAEMSGIDTSDPSSENGFSSFLDRLCLFDKPLVTAVNGVGVGIGLTMLLHCDYVYISRTARLRAPFVTLGVVPEAASSYLLPLIVGHRNATKLLFESDFIDATTAVDIGIANQLCDPGQLLDRAMEKARELAAKPLGSLRGTKRLMMATRAEQIATARAREDAAFIRRIGSPENMEAVMAFMEKRAPDFSKVDPGDKKS